MSGRYYTLASWFIKQGQEEAFIRAWKEELAAAFTRSFPTATGTLIQSLDEPRQFYSFGPWESLEQMGAARSDPGVQEAIRKVIALCDDARPGPYREVLRIPEA